MGLAIMELDFLISISCLIGAIALGISLAIFNGKRAEETHELRMEIYRRYKRAKNERLRRALGLPNIGTSGHNRPQVVDKTKATLFEHP